jgi:hypothetical protein
LRVTCFVCLQIMVSFLQVAGIMRNLQLHWPPAIRDLFVVDPTSTFSYIPMDCSIGGDSRDKAYARTAILVFLPGMPQVHTSNFVRE